MSPEEVEDVVGKITEKDVMQFARKRLWDQDVAISAIGQIEGLLGTFSRGRLPFNTWIIQYADEPRIRLQPDTQRHEQECIDSIRK